MFVPNRFNWNSNDKSTRFLSDHSNPFETFQLEVDEKLAPMVYVAKPAILGSWRAGRGIPDSHGHRRRKMVWNCVICGINSHWGSWHKASTLSFLLNFLILLWNRLPMFWFSLNPHGCSWQVNAKQKKRQLGAGKKGNGMKQRETTHVDFPTVFLHSKSSMIWWSWSSFNTLLEWFPVTSNHNPFWKFCTWALLKNTRITNWQIASNSSVLIHTAAALPSPFVCSSLAFFFHMAKILLSI